MLIVFAHSKGPQSRIQMGKALRITKILPPIRLISLFCPHPLFFPPFKDRLVGK